MTIPYYDSKLCHHKHDRHRSESAVWYYSTGWLQCLECGGWQHIKHRITTQEPKK